MGEPRWSELAETLLGHSIRLQPGESVWIEAYDLADSMLMRELVRGVARRRARVVVSTWDSRVLRELIRVASAEQLLLWAALDRDRLDKVDAYLDLRGDSSPHEWAEIAPAASSRYNALYLKPVHWELRIPSKRWCLARLPGPFLAQQAGMGCEALESMYWKAVSVDYPRLRQAMRPLAERIAAGRRVRIVGPETDLRFELPGRPPVICAGEKNIPDGEVFTAPVVESVEGKIGFNTRAIFRGRAYEGIELEFERGRVKRSGCRSGDAQRLARILESDEGSCRVGEWGIGCNALLTGPVGDVLLDEKLAGSHHLALGFAYAEADNGNRSSLHWDMVQVLMPEWGGGRIEIDGEPVVEDGCFLDPLLTPLNPGA